MTEKSRLCSVGVGSACECRRAETRASDRWAFGQGLKDDSGGGGRGLSPEEQRDSRTLKLTS